MLEIPDMFDDQLFFDFKDGLKDWVNLELDRREVKTLDEAIVEVESLKDYTTQNKGKKPNSSKSGEAPKKDSNKSKESYKKPFSGDSKQHKGSLGENKFASKLPIPCFICDDPHWVKDCSKRKAINALVSEFSNDGTQNKPQAEMGSL